MISRRQVLRGLGGFTLALPFLPSLIGDRRAEAQAAVRPRRFVAMGIDHGGVFNFNMFPADSMLTRKMSYAGFEIRAGALAPVVTGPRASLSPVLTADADKLQKVLGKMLVLRGVDIAANLGHNAGGYLGNYAANNSSLPITSKPSIDQVLAYSPSFYSQNDLSGTIKNRIVDMSDGMSFAYENPSARTGMINQIRTSNSPRDWFQRLFGGGTTGGTAHKPVVDLVLADYKRLRTGDRQISSADKQRLDDWMDRIDELQRRLSITVNCGTVPPPPSPLPTSAPDFSVNAELDEKMQGIMNDIIVNAFACGISRIGLIRPPYGSYFLSSPLATDYHGNIAHQQTVADRQTLGALRAQHFFEFAFLDLVYKLDQYQEATGGTLLDNSIVQWTQECGAWTHDSVSIPVIAAGGGGGLLKTGQYCDYRNLTRLFQLGGGSSTYDAAIDPQYPGLLYNQWLGTVLQAMGLQKGEYESTDVGGYGDPYLYPRWSSYYPDPVFSAAGEVMPFLRAA